MSWTGYGVRPRSFLQATCDDCLDISACPSLLRSVETRTTRHVNVLELLLFFVSLIVISVQNLLEYNMIDIVLANAFNGNLHNSIKLRQLTSNFPRAAAAILAVTPCTVNCAPTH